jgi:hypothetical protein
MIEPAYRTQRYVLRPEKHWDDVAAFADRLGWPLAHETTRNQNEGLDGQMIWQSPAGVSLHYVVDATSGIGYITLAGPDQKTVEDFTAQALEALDPWQLTELFHEYDRATEVAERGKLTLRLGLAAPPEFTEGCFRRIASSLSDSDPRIRLAGLWAASYTGYQAFVPVVRRVAEEDSEEWLRTRASSIVAAFDEVGGTL